jgi:inosose dehydratase
MRIGCGQITWRGRAEREALADIARAGYEGSPPPLDVPRSAEETVRFYRSYGLETGPPYFAAPFWRDDLREDIIERARQAATFVHQLGCGEMYVAAAGEYTARSGRTRREVAGHVRPNDGLSDAEWRCLVETLNAIGDISLHEDVRTCFHSHVGTVVETADEVERLVASSDADLVFLGPDTGHLAWAGVDVVDFCQRHMPRIKTMHWKDIDESVRSRGCQAGWDYRAFADNGIFVELGEGWVEFPSILRMLRENEFDGWLIVETDVTRKPSAFDSARCSREYLRGLSL